MVRGLGSNMLLVKPVWPSTRSACGSVPWCWNGLGKRSTRPLPESAT